MIDTKQLEEASACYYNGNPVMTDSEFDQAISDLREIEPDHPFLKRIGAPVPGTVKAKHKIPMGSLDNAHDEQEFRAWIPDDQPQICLSHKLDGSSVELIYENGHFVQAITRGDGEEGEDVTKNVLRSGNIPLIVDPSIISVRCECLIHKDDWQKHFEGDANPRNSAAGTLRRHGGHNAEYLKFYAFDALFDNDITYIKDRNILIKSEDGVLWLLSEWFCVPYWISLSNPYNLCEWCQTHEADRDEFAYEIDGIVAKIDDRVKSQALGSRDGRPRGQVAIKFKPRGGETVLRSVTWQVGHTGVLTPVGKVDPVGVGGVTITSVTLYNINEIRRLSIAVGDTVEVIRAGDTIPKLSRLVKPGDQRESIFTPKICPECLHQTIRDGPRVLCPNKICTGKFLSRVMTWIRKRNILDLGIGIVKAANIWWIEELYEMTECGWASVKVKNGVVGPKRAKKIVEALEKSRSVTLPDFLGSIGIKGVGRSLMSDLCKNFTGTYGPNCKLALEDIFGLTKAQIARQQKFGVLRAADFCDWLKEHRDEVMSLGSIMDFQYESNQDNGVLDGHVICFTGKSPRPRSEMAKLAEWMGASTTNSITSSTTILVIADKDSTSSKAVKARKAGIELILPEEFLTMCGE